MCTSRRKTRSRRVAVRQAETKPLMDALWSWLMERLEAISAKSSLASAIRYTLGHWKGLTLFLSDGRVEVDNNTVERGIRPIPLGRKNSLFAGSDSGGERWAVLASLINTAKQHDIDPQTYLADVRRTRQYRRRVGHDAGGDHVDRRPLQYDQ
jgi:transposase